MAKQPNLVLPTEIDMSWAAQNPAADSDIGEHLQGFTHVRGLWAERVQDFKRRKFAGRNY